MHMRAPAITRGLRARHSTFLYAPALLVKNAVHALTILSDILPLKLSSAMESAPSQSAHAGQGTEGVARDDIQTKNISSLLRISPHGAHKPNESTADVTVAANDTVALRPFMPPPPPPPLMQYLHNSISQQISDTASPVLDPQASVCELSDSSSPADAAESKGAIAEREADPFSKDYKQTLTIDEPTSSQFTPRDMLYSFLYGARVSALKGPSGPLKQHKLPQSLNKQAMVSALLHVVSKAVADGGGSVGFDDGVVFSAGDANRWLNSPARPRLSLFEAPTDALLEKFTPVTSRGKKRKSAQPSAAFSVNEFARVVALLITNHDVRRALLRSGLDLTRGELDRGVGRDDFWVTEVEPVMNDSTLKFALPGGDLPLPLATVDPNAPVIEPRAGELLKRKFYEARSHFTRWYSNWNVSGNYSVENFHQFVSPPPIGSSAFPTSSLCAMILFHALRCGQKEADMDIINFVAKTADGDCIYDDAIEEENHTMSRKINRGAVCNDTHISLLPVLQQVSKSISSLATAGKSSNERNKFQEIEEEATKSSYMSSLVQNMRKLSTDIRAARKEGEDEEIIGVMQDELASVMKLIRRFRESS
jgi:hypothetical protein